MSSLLSSRILKSGILAGTAGGVAEIVWVTVYGNLSGIDPAFVAQEVARTVFPALPTSAPTTLAGLGIHMALAIGLGIAAVSILRAAFHEALAPIGEAMTIVAALVAVWAFNFLILLPQLNPSFVTLLPLAATLTSKVLFGLAAAGAMAASRRP
jgi:hypothetical protein